MTHFEDPTEGTDAMVVAIDLKTKSGADFAEQLGMTEVYVRRDIAVALHFAFPYLVIVKKRGALSKDAFLAIDLPGLEEAIKVGTAIGRAHGSGQTVCMAMPKELSHTLWQRIGVMRTMTKPPAG